MLPQIASQTMGSIMGSIRKPPPNRRQWVGIWKKMVHQYLGLKTMVIICTLNGTQKQTGNQCQFANIISTHICFCYCILHHLKFLGDLPKTALPKAHYSNQNKCCSQSKEQKGLSITFCISEIKRGVVSEAFKPCWVLISFEDKDNINEDKCW